MKKLILIIALLLMGDDCQYTYVNLFNKDAIYPNKNLSSGELIDAVNNDVTDFIPIKPNTTYATNTKRVVAYYDANRTYISSNVVNSGAPATFETVAGAYYMRMVLGHFDNAPYNYLDMLQIVEQSDTYFPFRSPYGCSNSKWANKIWSTLGNSITDQFLWQPTVMDEIGLRCNEYGQGGTTIGGIISDSCMYEYLRITQIDTKSNLISVMGGTNDWGQSVPLGTLYSVDTTTFYGGLNIMIDRLVALRSNAKILLTTPPYAYKSNWAAAGWADSLTNNVHLTLVDYVNAIKAVGTARGVPVCDLYTLSGIDKTNWATYTQEGIHPNQAGGIKIGEALAEYLKANYDTIMNEVITPVPFVFNVTCTSTGDITMKGTGAVTVDWGDGNSNAYTLASTDQNISHTYAGAGTYTIKISTPSRITRFYSTANSAFVFDLNELTKTSMTRFGIVGTNSITGNISSTPSTVTFFDVRGTTKITGDIASLSDNTGMTYFFCTGDNTLNGNLASLPANITYFYVGDVCRISDYTSGRTWANNINRIYMKTTTGYGLSSTEVDNLLIDLANVSTWVVVKSIDLRGNNAARTSASDAAKATLEGKGVTVLTN